MTYKHLFEKWDFLGYPLKNRVGVPPLVIRTWTDETGRVTDKQVAHYKAFTTGGAGMVFQEATAVSPTGKIYTDQLGIWEDAQIPGLSRLPEIFHAAGMPAIVQLGHAGILSAGRENQVAPSAYECFGNGEERVGRELTVAEIEQIERDFINAAKRAATCGYDGVELHACHGYLLSEFLNSRMNRRTDKYRAKDKLIVKNIIEGIRANTPKGFILGIRLGAFEPTIADGIAHAKWLEQMGIDYIDAYVGCDWEMEMEKPDSFPFNASIYGGMRIKQAVNLPVFAALNIRAGDEAEAILEKTGLDMVLLGRASLVDYEWAKDVAAGRDVGKCYECPTCQWDLDPKKCPGRRGLVRAGRLKPNV